MIKQLFFACCLFNVITPLRGMQTLVASHTAAQPAKVATPEKHIPTRLERFLGTSPVKAQIACWEMIFDLDSTTEHEKKKLFCIIRNLLFFQHPNLPYLLYIFGCMLNANANTLEDTNQGIQYLQQAGDLQHAPAQCYLGTLYCEGSKAPQSHKLAAMWYQKAADQQYAPAQYGLGTMYYFGYSVPQSYELAAQWIQKAANQQYRLAQKNLGTLYELGHGVPQSYHQAARYYRAAIATSHEKAHALIEETHKLLERLYNQRFVQRPFDYAFGVAYQQETCSICNEDDQIVYDWPCKTQHASDCRACKECIQFQPLCAYCRQPLQLSLKQ